MFVKQIDAKTALELAAKGKDVLVMVPGEKDSGWEDMTPDTLQHMLDGCLFFRREPAMEVDLVAKEKQTVEIGPPEPEKAQSDPPPAKNPKNKLKVDTGKMIALRKAGWSMKKIAEELKISEGSVYNYLKKMEGEHYEASDIRTSERD